MSVNICINAVSFVPGSDHVTIIWSGVALDPTNPFAKMHILSTTQSALEARSGIPSYWGDPECKAELSDYLIANAIDAVLIVNPGPPAPDYVA